MIDGFLVANSENKGCQNENNSYKETDTQKDLRFLDPEMMKKNLENLLLLGQKKHGKQSVAKLTNLCERITESYDKWSKFAWNNKGQRFVRNKEQTADITSNIYCPIRQ